MSAWEKLASNVPEQFLQGMQLRQAEIEKAKQQLEGMPAGPSGFSSLDLTPAIAWADSINRTNLAQSYRRPEDQNAKLRQQLAERIAKQEQAIADDQIKWMNALRKDDEFDQRMEMKQKYLDLYGEKGELAKKKAEDQAARGPKLPEGAYQAAGFAKRLQQSEEIFDSLLNSGYQGPNRGQAIAGAILPNELISPQFQKFDQATRNYINATLRRESGASIAESEFQNARKQYIPQPGDTDEMLAQKAANRRQVFENFRAEGQSAFDKMAYVSPVRAEQKGMGIPESGSVRIRKGNEVLEIPREDLNSAIKDGYSEVK